MPLHKKFQSFAAQVQAKHQRFFDALPAQPEKFKTIDGHYYIFSGASGAKLRFQTDSELTAAIRRDLEEAFNDFIALLERSE